MNKFKGYHQQFISYDAMGEIRQLRFNGHHNKRKLKEAYADLHIDGHTLCPYCNEVFTGYWSKHNCEIHIRFDHEKENTKHVVATLTTFFSLFNTYLDQMIDEAPAYRYHTSLAGDEILERPRWFNHLFLKHYNTLTFVHNSEPEGITLKSLYSSHPQQEERDKIRLELFNLQLRHLVHASEESKGDFEHQLLSEIEQIPLKEKLEQ